MMEPDLENIEQTETPLLIPPESLHLEPMDEDTDVDMPELVDESDDEESEKPRHCKRPAKSDLEEEEVEARVHSRIDRIDKVGPPWFDDRDGDELDEELVRQAIEESLCRLWCSGGSSRD